MNITIKITLAIGLLVLLKPSFAEEEKSMSSTSTNIIRLINLNQSGAFDVGTPLKNIHGFFGDNVLIYKKPNKRGFRHGMIFLSGAEERLASPYLGWYVNFELRQDDRIRNFYLTPVSPISFQGTSADAVPLLPGTKPIKNE